MHRSNPPREQNHMDDPKTRHPVRCRVFFCPSEDKMGVRHSAAEPEITLPGAQTEKIFIYFIFSLFR
jgi:hypothetical protein